MVSRPETIPSRLLMMSSDPSYEAVLARLADLEQELTERQAESVPHKASTANCF